MVFKSKYSGLDFHDRSFSFATIRIDRGMPVIQDLGIKEVDHEIFTGGRIAQDGLLATSLRNILQKGKLSKNVHLAIPTQNILVRKITTLPDIPEKDLEKIIKFQIGESIHLPFEKAVYDFVKVGSLSTNKFEENEDDLDMDDKLVLNDLASGRQLNLDSPKSEILLFATSELLSQDLVDVCSSASLKPITAEIRALALQRLLLYTHPNWLKEVEMIIDLSEKSFDIHIFKGGLIAFSRMITLNQNDYIDSPVHENQNDDLLLFEDIPTPFIETQKEVAVTTDEIKSRLDDSYLTNIVLEIEKAQNFFRYSMNERDSEVNRIIVTGEKTNQYFELLKDRIDFPTVARIDYSSILNDSFTNKDLLDSCSVAIGLAIRANEKRDYN